MRCEGFIHLTRKGRVVCSESLWGFVLGGFVPEGLCLEGFCFQVLTFQQCNTWEIWRPRFAYTRTVQNVFVRIAAVRLAAFR